MIDAIEQPARAPASLAGAASAAAPPPAAESAWLYAGTLMHARLKPVAHRFSYKVLSLIVDVDRLAEAACLSPLFSVGRFNLFAFHEADHGPADGSPLRPHIDALLAAAGFHRRPARILLLCYPRILGYVFNPLSVYYCYDAGGGLAALVYEVRNTFGERHSYVAPVRADERGDGGVRQERDKLLYVSPFLGMAMRYRFRVQAPGDTLALRILVGDGDGPVLAAAFRGSRSEISGAALGWSLVSMPWRAVQVIGAIHWQALQLWIKGMRFHTRPAPPAGASLDGRMLRVGTPTDLADA